MGGRVRGGLLVWVLVSWGGKGLRGPLAVLVSILYDDNLDIWHLVMLHLVEGEDSWVGCGGSAKGHTAEPSCWFWSMTCCVHLAVFPAFALFTPPTTSMGQAGTGYRRLLGFRRRSCSYVHHGVACYGGGGVLS